MKKLISISLLIILSPFLAHSYEIEVEPFTDSVVYGHSDTVGGIGATCNPSTPNWGNCTLAPVPFQAEVTNTVYIAEDENATHFTTPFEVDQPNTEYILQRDITAAGTAISVTANYVIVNLNGHTITYNQTEPGEGVNIGAWNKHHISINNGSIIQGSAMSEGDQYGRGNNPVSTYNTTLGGLRNVNDMHVANLYVGYGGRDVNGIMGSGSNGLYEENTIEDTYSIGTLKNRHQGNKALTGTEGVLAVGNIYRNNTLLNIHHRGIDVGNSSTAHGNHISINSVATNASGMAVGTTDLHIYNNTIIARGVSAIGMGFSALASSYQPRSTSNIHIHHNHIDAKTTRLGSEYASAYESNPMDTHTGLRAIGFRTTWGGHGIHFHNNDVYVHSDSFFVGDYAPTGQPAYINCESKGIMAMLLNGESALFEKNNITAIDKDGTGKAAGIAIAGYHYGYGGNNGGLVFRYNRVTSNIANITTGDSYGASPGWPLFLQNLLIKQDDFSSYKTYQSFLGGYDVQSGRFVANTYQDGAARDSYAWYFGNHNTERNAWRSFLFGELVKVRITDGGSPVADLALTVDTTNLPDQARRCVTYDTGPNGIYLTGVQTFCGKLNAQIPTNSDPENIYAYTDINGEALVIRYSYELHDIGTAHGDPTVLRVNYATPSILVADDIDNPSKPAAPKGLRVSL